ncbi:MAG: tRNA nucleotidyltransferase [Candidatus Marinimicrobia bacterium]|nr:tRNA nucleotidyltransferase [Candidatus Neomarinimicrobiota bacterium]
MSNIKELISQYPDAEYVLKRAGKIASENNKQIYVVGGFVRDLFIQKKPVEIDLMIIGDGIEFAEILAKDLKVKKVIPFKQFSTAKIPYKKIYIEVAAARLEKYDNKSRKPKEVIYTDLKGDLIRRDFTINSMAVDLLPENYGDLYDPYSGISDLQSKRIITPLNPDDTFSEDPLRMLRAAYFASKFEFEIDKKCYDSIIRQKKRISIVSQERITTELCKILSSPIPSIGLIILQDTGLMKLIFPEIDEMYGIDQTPEWHHKDIFFHTMQVVDNAAKLTQKMEIRFAALVHDIAKPVTRRVDKKKGYTFHGHDAVGEKILNKVIKRMKLSNNLGEFLKKMTLLHLRPIALAKKSVTDSAVRRLMVAAGVYIDDLMILCRADITTKNPNKVNKYMKNFERVDILMKDVKERDLFSQFQSPVRGKEIMEICNLKEGKKIGELKKAIEEAILDGKIDNNHDDALNYLYQIKDKYIL